MTREASPASWTARMLALAVLVAVLSAGCSSDGDEAGCQELRTHVEGLDSVVLANGFSSSEAAWMVVLTTDPESMSATGLEELGAAVAADSSGFEALVKHLPGDLTEDVEILRRSIIEGGVRDDRAWAASRGLFRYSAEECGFA